jgi:hypothetical protein
LTSLLFLVYRISVSSEFFFRRAMETVVNQHGIDMDALRSSRVPFAGGPQALDPSGVMSKDKEIIGGQAPMVGSDASQGSGQAASWQLPSGNQLERETSATTFGDMNIIFLYY